jgi:hypothetical protein
MMHECADWVLRAVCRKSIKAYRGSRYGGPGIGPGTRKYQYGHINTINKIPEQSRNKHLFSSHTSSIIEMTAGAFNIRAEMGDAKQQSGLSWNGDEQKRK